MSRYEVFGGLGVGWVGGALLVLLPGTGWGLAFLFVGTLLIVHAVLGKKREEAIASTSFIPGAKELHEQMESKARSQKAVIELAVAEREQRVLCYLDFLADDFDTKIADAKKRGAVLNRTAYFDRPLASEGENQQEVDEAYHRFCKIRGLLNPRAA
jgi:hypothetical protein